ncbi:MAG: TaqI-like C-terminal specificity domain-containing protein [Desulfobacteria bacterium]
MDKQQARSLIKTTFEQPFDKDRFTRFMRDLLNHIEDDVIPARHGQFIPEAYRQYISTLERIGKYHDGENRIDILIIKLQRKTSLEHARTNQRNFVAGYLQGKYGSSNEKEAALVAFVSPDEEDWRFSLVKMDYKFEQTATGKMRVKEEFTPARRWSFLVGVNENSHTAQSRLVKILTNDEPDPTLADLEKAFNIETVTKEFFLKYRDLFIQTKEALDRVVENDAKIKADFEDKEVNTVDFAKKLLGQIVFLYFLQKKGWFGVGRDDEWGTGSKHFLRELFEKKHSDYHNFFNDILEPLFYEALRVGEERKQDDYYYSRFNCKIPFLNGGLFDPIGLNGGYDWVKTDILLPDSLFSNQNKTREGDEGDGILDIFDCYNFTVKEDEPLEKEVAIDPELLGKAYEKFNAIRPDNFEAYKKALKSGKKGDESKFNKQFGVYYTPREIVHYMCQQSLINYLFTELNSGTTSYEKLGDSNLDMLGNEAKKGQLDITIKHRENPEISKEDIETLIHLGEQVSENEEIALLKEKLIEEGKQKTARNKLVLPESIRNNAELIDAKLAEITVCDPAVGSGAFPVGMMNEIVKTRSVLNKFIADKDDRTPYHFKRRCIEHSLYGVDIDPGAVEIAKLRLWLSLVVDEDDIKNIKPLPNLDYKIVYGNSLLGVPDGVLVDCEISNKLEENKKLYFNSTNPSEKNRIRGIINNLFLKLIDSMKKVDPSIQDITFDFHTHFSEVFHEKSGFDVVIANPPYVRHEAIRDIKPHLAKAFGNFFCGTADLYTYFYKSGIDLLKPLGYLCFIAPNKFMRAGYGKNTRVLLTTQVTPKLLIDFGDLPIFDATTYPSIILVEKRRPDSQDKAATATFTEANQLERLEETLSRIGFSMPVASLKKEGWNLEQPEVLALMEKLRSSGIPLGEYVQGRFYRGVLTGFNEAFVIDAVTREKLIDQDPASTDLIKPWLRGRDIRKWKVEWAGLYLIMIASSANKEWHWSKEKTEAKARPLFAKDYPAIYRHLSQYEDKLRIRDDQGKFWWELRSCGYWEEFERPKIVYPEVSADSRFTVVDNSHFTDKTTFIMPIKLQQISFVLALANSKLMSFFQKNLGSMMRGRYFMNSKIYIEKIPIFSATDTQKAPIVEHVQKILANPDSPAIPHLEAEIDKLVYELYGLTADEIGIVEGSLK